MSRVLSDRRYWCEAASSYNIELFVRKIDSDGGSRELGQEVIQAASQNAVCSLIKGPLVP